MLHTQSRRSIKRTATTGSSPSNGGNNKKKLDMSCDSYPFLDTFSLLLLSLRWQKKSINARKKYVRVWTSSSLLCMITRRSQEITHHTRSHIYSFLFLSTFPIKVFHDRKKVRQNPSGRVAWRYGAAKPIIIRER